LQRIAQFRVAGETVFVMLDVTEDTRQFVGVGINFR
jgi:hypothetical protein